MWTNKETEVMPQTAYFANHASGCISLDPERTILHGNAKLQRALRSTLMVQVDFYVYGFDGKEGGENRSFG
jgi:hypothetical protein